MNHVKDFLPQVLLSFEFCCNLQGKAKLLCMFGWNKIWFFLKKTYLFLFVCFAISLTIFCCKAFFQPYNNRICPFFTNEFLRNWGKPQRCITHVYQCIYTYTGVCTCSLFNICLLSLCFLVLTTSYVLRKIPTMNIFFLFLLLCHSC